METTPPPSPNGSIYVSAPTSPSRYSLEHMCFYSMQPSPDRNALKARNNHGTEPTTPKTYEDANSFLDEFEFETSLRFNLDEYDFNRQSDHQQEQRQKEEEQQQQQQQRQRKEYLPAMAFADELFCGGKVVPLKPPPGLQYKKDNKFGKQSSTLSSPRSPTRVLKLTFSRRSLWNDDFDPFMVALENVKEEKEPKTQGRKPIFTTVTRNNSMERNESGFPSTRESERPKIKRFLFRSASTGNTSNEEKVKDEEATKSKPKMKRKFSFKSMGFITKYNEEKRVTKMTLIHYRPKLLLCMGFGQNM